MEKSENFEFYLPSRDSDDIVDVNQLSDNFRKIDNYPQYVEETYATKQELKDAVDLSCDLSGVAPAIKNTVSGEQSLTVNDVSPLAHKCSLKVVKNFYPFSDDNVKFILGDTDLISYEIKDNIITHSGTTQHGFPVRVTLKDLEVGKTYTLSMIKENDNFFVPAYFITKLKSGSENVTTDFPNGYHTFIVTDDVEYYEAEWIFYSNTDKTLEIQLTLGSAPIVDFATVRVYVNNKVYHPMADGTVTDIDSISPTMEITTDNEHVNICDFSYCADTKKYVDNAISTKPEYELINTITVSPDTDGELPINLIIDKDSNGNSFELSSVYVNINGAPSSSTNYGFYAKVNNISIVGNVNIGLKENQLRKCIFSFRELDDGFMQGSISHSTLANTYWNAQSPIETNILIPPQATANIKTIKKIDMYCFETKWMSGSTFELWGVRK